MYAAGPRGAPAAPRRGAPAKSGDPTTPRIAALRQSFDGMEVPEDNEDEGMPVTATRSVSQSSFKEATSPLQQSKMRFADNEPVEAYDEDADEWLGATVIRKKRNGTYTIQFDSGAEVAEQPPELIRREDGTGEDGSIRFDVVVEREDLSVSWGVELTSDSKRSLTITRISAGGVFDQHEQFQAGDVIVSIDDLDLKADMLGLLKSETAIHLHVVRFPVFEVMLEKSSAEESLAVEVEAASASSLVLKAITSAPKENTAVVRYNNKNFEKPLVPGDVIVSANESSDMKTMVSHLKTRRTIKLMVKRAYA